MRVLTMCLAYAAGGGGMGAIHVCEHVDCKLPAEDWFQTAAAAKAQAQRTSDVASLGDGVSFAAAAGAEAHIQGKNNARQG